METTKTYKFLILEDNSSDAALIKRELEKNWENVLINVICTPNDLRTGLKEIEWDVIISDYSMPQFTGYDAMRITQESDQNPLFFLMSGVKGEEIAAEAMRMGARDYIDKNFPGRMIISIKKALAEAEDSKELQVTRKELYKSEKKYRDIINYAPVGYFQIIPDGRFLEVNPALIKMLKYESDSDFIENMKLEMLFKHDNPDTLCADILRKAIHNSFESREVELHTKDGSTIWVILSIQAVTDSSSNTQYYNGFIVDITDQKGAEHAMKESAKRWYDTFNSITNVIMLLSADFEIIEINDAGCRLYKKTREELTGRKCFEIVHSTSKNPEFCPAIKASKSKSMELSEIEENGRYYMITAWPIFDKDNEIIAYSHAIQDITERKMAEKEIENYRDHLQEIVQSRTKELQQANEELKQKNNDLENMHKLFIGREDRIKDLRDQIKELKLQLEEIREK